VRAFDGLHRASPGPGGRGAGKKIVSGVCFLCHGSDGASASEVFPRLAGQHWQYIAKQLENFKSGKRESTAMADMAAKLTPDEMVALAGISRSFPPGKRSPKTCHWPMLVSTSSCMAIVTAEWQRVPHAMARTLAELRNCPVLPASMRHIWKVS